MKPTFQPKTTAHTANITTSTADILEPLKTAALQTIKLGDKKPATTTAKRRSTGPVHRIIHGECLEMMAKIPERSIDFICADFPYNISGKGGLTMRRDQVVKADF